MPQTGREWQGFISVRGDVLDELVVGEASRLGQPVHTASNFDVDVSLMNEGAEVVFVDKYVGNHVDWNPHVFISIHRGSQIIIF